MRLINEKIRSHFNGIQQTFDEVETNELLDFIKYLTNAMSISAEKLEVFESHTQDLKDDVKKLEKPLQNIIALIKVNEKQFPKNFLSAICEQVSRVAQRTKNINTIGNEIYRASDEVIDILNDSDFEL